MPRPPDTYTHSQFEPANPDDPLSETVRCTHCNRWTGNVKVLNRKKEHLLKCPPYVAWRASGNGQDIAPQNSYNKRDSSAMQDQDGAYYSPYGDYDAPPPTGPQHTPSMGRPRTLDVAKAFEEFWDDSGAQKCMRSRCRYCGYVRAKNTTRQFEHLVTCKDFHASPEGQEARTNGELALAFPPQPQAPTASANNTPLDIWRGRKPNPNLSTKARPGQKNHRMSAGSPMTPARPQGPPRPAPSLVNHLLAKDSAGFTRATQQPFLSHAGCGTLSAPALLQWLAQDSHISRAFVSFIGALIAKIRLPETHNSQQNTTFRAMDLLISALNNVRREMTFFEVTQSKYGLQVGGEQPKPATKGYLDLFASASHPSASLLEGLVVLWATEHCYRTSWHYAASFNNTMSSSTYSLPSYLNPSQSNSQNPYGPSQTSSGPDSGHIDALRQALIPNWTSPAFSKFVDACRAIVDELANSYTTGNGMEEMHRCESHFKQVIWLWERIWPEVNGMGEEDDLTPEEARHPVHETGSPAGGNGATAAGPSRSGANGNVVRHNTSDDPIEIAEDGSERNEDDAQGETVDSPYGGLGAVHAANQTA